MTTRALVMVVTLLAGTCSHAYPDRPLTLVVPFHASGSPDIEGTPRASKLIKVMQTLSAPSLTDSLVQDLAYSLSIALGQPVNLRRQARGNTMDGARYAAQATPDGHTLLFSGNQMVTIFPSLYPQLALKLSQELLPVANMARIPLALITAGDNPSQNVRDVILHARRLPGQLNYAAVGDGTTSHMTGASFRIAGGIDIVHVNYNGSVAAINAVVTRQVEFGFVPLTAVLPYLGGGKVRIIGIASATRHPATPGAPTIAESGLNGFEAEGWFGVFVAMRTPRAIVSRLNYEINRVIAEDEVQRSLSGRGLLAAPGTTEDFQVLIEKDRERWGRLLGTFAVR